MEKIKTIRLYRYNIGITEENDCTEYMTMDYFDSFDVEEEEDIIKWMHWEWREIFISCYAGNVF